MKNPQKFYTPIAGVPLAIPICAREKYSSHRVEIKAGEKYVFWCDDDQYWRDLFLKQTPAGYNNVMASLLGLRLDSALCFCLCGSINDDENMLFEIGLKMEKTFNIDGFVSFFANDTPGFYWNNSGAITLNILKEIPILFQELALQGKIYH